MLIVLLPLAVALRQVIDMVVKQERVHIIAIHALFGEAECLCDLERGHIAMKRCPFDLASCTKPSVAKLLKWPMFAANLAFADTHVGFALREVNQFTASCKLVLYTYSTPLLKCLVHIPVVWILQHAVEAFTAGP